MKNLTWGVKGRGETRVPRFKRIWKNPIQYGDPNPHRKFQHSNSIRRCLKIKGNEMQGERRRK